MDRDSDGIPEFEQDSLLFHSVFQNIVASDNEDNSSIFDIPKSQYLFWMDWQRRILEQGWYRFGIAGLEDCKGYNWHFSIDIWYGHIWFMRNFFKRVFNWKCSCWWLSIVSCWEGYAKERWSWCYN